MNPTQTGKKNPAPVTALEDRRSADKTLRALKFLYPDKPVHELKRDIEVMEREASATPRSLFDVYSETLVGLSENICWLRHNEPEVYAAMMQFFFRIYRSFPVSVSFEDEAIILLHKIDYFQSDEGLAWLAKIENRSDEEKARVEAIFNEPKPKFDPNNGFDLVARRRGRD